MVQWLGLGAFTSVACGPGSIPGQGTKIPQAVLCGLNRQSCLLIKKKENNFYGYFKAFLKNWSIVALSKL